MAKLSDGCTCRMVAAIFSILLLTRNTTGDICRRRRIHLRVRYGTCVPKTIPSFGCLGACLSYSQPSSTPGQVERSCICCKERTSVERRFPMLCERRRNGVGFRTVRFRIRQPTSCLCRPCSVVDHIRPSEELVSPHK